jgi:hypothetical protein
MIEYTRTIKCISEYDYSECPTVLLWHSEGYWTMAHYSTISAAFMTDSSVVEKSDATVFSELPPEPQNIKRISQ